MPQPVHADTKRWITGKNEKCETKKFNTKAINHIDPMLLFFFFARAALSLLHKL